MIKNIETISILIPCHNEEKGVSACIDSCLNQTRLPDQILVVNDGSTDKSAEILASYGDKIQVITIPVATGNKSYAQERGLRNITGSIFIATDGDTILDKNFVEEIEKSMQDKEVMAVGGYVRSLKHNWLTACREIDYIVGQDIHKVAQSYLNFLFVIPGCAGGFRTNMFLEYMKFEHDTLTEDLDFTYRLHQNRFKIFYNKKAIVYTQDPDTIRGYANQMRRWYAGGWQNLRKHIKIVMNPWSALEMSLMYIEGIIFAMLIYIFPILNINFFKFFLLPYFIFMLTAGIYGAIKRKRNDLIYSSPLYIILIYVNSSIFLETFFKEIIMRKNNLSWFHPERREITSHI